jgi:acyl carrier protein
MSRQERGPLSEAAVRTQVAAIWNAILGASDGDDSTFFDLNGQSISAVRIVAGIKESTGVQIDIGDLFEDLDLATLTDQVLARAELVAEPLER